MEQTYGHDLAGRLGDVWQDGALVLHVEHDAHGNRTLTERAGEPSIVATFDAQDRIASFGGATFTHAITGERLTKTTAAGTTTSTYDALGQLTSVTLPDATVIAYLYDAAAVSRRNSAPPSPSAACRAPPALTTADDAFPLVPPCPKRPR